MFATAFPFYGIMILLSFLLNIITVLLIYKRFSFSKDEVIGALFYENIGILFGGKLLTLFQNNHMDSSFNFQNLGLSSYGGVIGAILFLILFKIQYKKTFRDIFFLFMPSIPLMYSIGKIGCFLSGCCYGIEYYGFGSIAIPNSFVSSSELRFFPVQLVESIVFFLIFLFMIYQINHKKFTWKTLGISFILMGFAKFSLDYLRMSHLAGTLSLNQMISILFIFIGFFLFLFYNKIR